MNKAELKEFLEAKVFQYNNPNFIESDPIQIPHLFSLQADIEISALVTATSAWVNRKSIIKNANKMMAILGNSPFDFVINHENHHLDNIEGFVHRTFNSNDLRYFIKALQHIYKNHNGLENVFSVNSTSNSTQPAIHQFKKIFFEISHPSRTTKHISDPFKGSAAKRINIFTRSIRVAQV